MEYKEKEKILEHLGKKNMNLVSKRKVIHHSNNDRNTSYEKNYNNIFKVLKERKCEPKNFYPSKLILKKNVKVKSLSGVLLFATPWTVAHQAPSSMGFSRQEYWSEVPLPSPYSMLKYTNPFCVPSTEL